MCSALKTISPSFLEIMLSLPNLQFPTLPYNSLDSYPHENDI